MMVARKHIAAIALLLVITVGIAFAAPLKPAAGFGDARIYDNTYKAVRNPSQVSEGYVIRTAGAGLVLSGDNITIEIHPDSLARIISLGSTPELYLLDGKADVSSASAFTVRTTVISYKAEAGTAICVITLEDEETAYVKSFSAVATNLITGEVETLSAPQSEPQPQPEQPEQGAQPETQAETGPEAATEPMTATITYQGFEATLTASEGTAVIEYPAFVRDDELLDAMQAVFARYPEFAKEITVAFGEPGTVYAYYPAEYGEAGFDLAVAILEEELPPYIDALMAMYAAQAAEAAAAAEPTVVYEPLVWSFDYRGISATVTAYPGVAYVTYPAAVTNEEIDAAAAALVATYPGYTDGITYTIVEPGLAVIYYPESYGEAEFALATAILDSELRPYIDWIAATAQMQTEEPAGETPVAEAPEAAEEPDQSASVKTPLETSRRPDVQTQDGQEEQQNLFRFGLAIGFTAGFGTDGDYYYAPSALDKRIGMFAKNFSITISPSFGIGNFTLALRLPVEVKDGKFVNPFTFKTGGITRTVSSIMHYVAGFGFATDNGVFRFNAERNSEIEFTSAIYEPFKVDYEKEDRLTLTGAVKLGGFRLTAFVEDLEFTNKLNGRSDFAGARASFGFAKTEIGISTAVDVRGGLKNLVFYPGADFTTSIALGEEEVFFSTQVAAQIKSGKLNAILAKTSFDIIVDKWLIVGFGVAYNHNSHINGIMNNGPVEVISQYAGSSIDVSLKGGLVFGNFSIVGDMTVPFKLDWTGGRLVYNTVLTRSGNTGYITADTMNARAEFSVGDFTFSTGVIMNGFSGRLANLLKSLVKRSDVVRNIKAILDPEIATYFALATFSTEIGDVTLETFARADLTRVAGTLTIPLSAGLGIKF